MTQQNSKKLAPTKSLALFGLAVCLLSPLSYSSSNQQAAAKRTIAALIQEVSSAQQSIDALYQKDLKVKTLLNDVAQLNAQIATIKNKAGISALESQLSGIQDQLNQGAVNIWANSVDPATSVNLNRTINKALNAIFIDDPIIKEKSEKVSMLKRDIGDRIAQKGWVKTIQTLGAAIESTAPNEIKQVSQALSAYQAAQTQVVAARNSNPSLDKTLLPLEIELAILQLNLKNKITENQLIHQQLFRYNNELKQLNFTIDLMQNPSKATHMTQEFISNFEALSNDTII